MTKQILLIGLGRFGKHIAKELYALDHQVLAIDEDEARLEEALPYITNGQIGDCTNEAFLASLALALGLSDEVQMSTGIHLDTMFVDEGFGSLDSDSLGKAYLALTGLTEGNRLVGIISHVAELKEKIDRQIVVKKERSGGSSAVITV